jgi:hypothetical protein
MTVTDRSAYSFKTDLSLAQILTRLDAVAPWQWVEWYNENWGDYVRTRGLAGGIVKIYVEPEHYVVQIKFESDASDAAAQLAELRATLFETVLPAIGARDLTPTATYD